MHDNNRAWQLANCVSALAKLCQRMQISQAGCQWAEGAATIPCIDVRSWFFPTTRSEIDFESLAN